ncbi:MAG TPA: imidazole glycerol phosphate synthase subunit HisH, partial [Acidimicrobiales bacterium]|nr:imidazole glycerol phosphate synthase subunit HisH [Acidimicrobiales bacterium]
MIAVLDYGIGNLRSAEKALRHVGGDARLVRYAEGAEGASGVVVPGVGAFGACVSALRASGLAAVATAAVETGVPVLGICVGFQMLFDGSDEDPEVAGLGLLRGRVRELPDSVKRPQMQWNVLRPTRRGSRLFGGLSESPWVYFVHSFAPVPEAPDDEAVAATCDYGGSVVAAVERGNLFGCQFHPEKSGREGLAILSA